MRHQDRRIRPNGPRKARAIAAVGACFHDPLDGVVGIRVIDLLCPVHLTMKSGTSAVAMLFKTKIYCRNSCSRIGNIVHNKPSGQGVATTAITIPAETAARRVVEWIALEIAVIAGLKLGKVAHGLEIASPIRGCGYVHREEASTATDGNLTVARRVCVCLARADIVPGIALKIHIVAGGRGASGDLSLPQVQYELNTTKGQSGKPRFSASFFLSY